MTSLSKLIMELTIVNEEIKKTNEMQLTLKKERTNLEKSIIEFLHKTNQPGFVYQGKIYTPESINKYQKKKKQEKEECIKNIFESGGIKVDKNIVDSVFEAFKSKPVPTTKLTYRKK